MLEEPKGIKEAEDIETGISIALSDIETMMGFKSPLTIHVEGKSGSGKTVFSTELMRCLRGRGFSCAMISIDDYVQADGQNGYKRDIGKLADDIEAARGNYQLVIVEGIIPHSEGKVPNDADYKVFLDSPLLRRIAIRFYKENLTGSRNIKQAMQQLAKGIGEDANAFDKYEEVRHGEDIQLFIQNNYEIPENPQLYILGNDLVFSVNHIIVEKVPLDRAQIIGLQKIGCAQF